MKIKSHPVNNKIFAEIISNDLVLNTVDDAIDLIGNLSYQGFEKIIIYEKNITPDFFDLKSQIAGNILQKFSQYSMPLAVIGNFRKYKSVSLNNFISESNRGKQVNFLATVEESLK